MGAEGLGIGGEVGIGQVGAADPAGVVPLLMHADGAEHVVVDHDHDDVQAILHRGRQLLPVHQVTAVAGEADHRALGVDGLGGDRRRQAVAHGPGGRRELGAVALVLEEAVDPDGIVAGAVGDDRILGQGLAQPGHHLAHLQLARRRGGLDVRQIVLARRRRPVVPGAPLHCGKLCRRVGEGLLPGIDTQDRLIDAAQLLGAGMDVDQRLTRRRNLQQSIATGRHLAQARPQGDQQIALRNARGQLRIDADADVADIVGVAIVEVVLAAKAAGDGQVLGLGEGLDRGTGCRRPTAAAEDDQRALRLAQQLGEAGHVGGTNRSLHAPILLGAWRRTGGAQDVLRQGQDHGARPPRGRGIKGAADELGNTVGVVDLRDPLGKLAIHAPVVDLLKGFAFQHVAGHLADEEDHRRGVLKGNMHAGAGAGRAGASRDEADPGLARQLAIGLGHHGRTPLLAAGDEAELGMIDEGVQCGEEALARHAEGQPRAVALQLLDQDLAAGPGGVAIAHGTGTLARRSVEIISFRR